MDNARLLDVIGAYEQISEFLDLPHFLLALVVSLLAAVASSAMYRVFYERRGTGSQVHKSFLLLSLAITTLFLCIQVSIPLSLGLLGSLSIIRFRTPVKEPEEVGFIMLVIASSIAAATFHFAFLAGMVFLAWLALVSRRWLVRGTAADDGGVLVVTAPAPLADVAALEKALGGEVGGLKARSASSEGGRATLQYSFTVMRNGFGGIQAAVLRAAPGASVNVYLSGSGGF